MAKYGIIRMQKFHKDAILGIQKHNQREGENSKNKDIDSSRTMLNYDFVNEDKIKYHEEIKKMTATRVKRKIRNDAVLVAEFFVSASPEYMHAMSPDEQRKYFEASLDHIAGKYGQQNILYAVVHNDEATPHMHVGFVPITDDRRLAAKEYFHGKTKIRRIQDDFHNYMNKRGYDIERGEPSELQHKSVHEFKKQEREKELKHLQQLVAHKEKELQQMDNLVELKAAPPVEIRSERRIEELCSQPIEVEAAKSVMGSKVKVEEVDFHELMSLTKELQQTLAAEHERTHALSHEVDRYEKENKALKHDLSETRQELEVYVAHQDREVEKAKKQMRQKLVHDFSAEQKENLKDEVKRELDTQYEAHISSLSDDLMIEKQKHEKTKKELVQVNEVNESLTKMNLGYIKDYVPKEELDEANKKVHELKEENKTLKAWKEKALNWIDKNVEKMKQMSFFQYVGGIRKQSKRQEQDLER
ncbi:plasmid recombination protein [Priestia sp. Y58]|uniref:MobV family relaxase n=1 Tax=Priestia TaxID=2800373 RepID=UPI001C8EB637|nr:MULTISPECIES: MobV family relaxase [Priestia]MBX9988907.1 plasmid recombination protein [Priestia aryabhattai]MBY0002718.1 plasmid recombination protein [Priestia aryabhattai]MDC7724473.1 MobV family relaxase [Priestia megaterium]MDG0033193.1 plasmid recombination protein [Priestia sp. Y58]MDG0062288.1 plasmid recombination protein [Priestia sp. P5]